VATVGASAEEPHQNIGVPFRVEYVRRISTARTDCGLIDNEEMGFPLLMGAHAVADAVKA
jgi:hypothetical protein